MYWTIFFDFRPNLAGATFCKALIVFLYKRTQARLKHAWVQWGALFIFSRAAAHSLWCSIAIHGGWGIDPISILVFVGTNALLAEACSWKRCGGIFWKNFSFLLYIKWESNVHGCPLPRTACWGSLKPQYTQKVFCCYAFRERFFMHPRIFKITWFRKESGDFLFHKKRRRIIWFVASHIEFNSKSFRSWYVTLDVMWCMVLC